MERLKPRDLQVVARILGGMTLSEVAKEFKISKEMVRKNVHRACSIINPGVYHELGGGQLPSIEGLRVRSKDFLEAPFTGSLSVRDKEVLLSAPLDQAFSRLAIPPRPGRALLVAFGTRCKTLSDLIKIAPSSRELLQVPGLGRSGLEVLSMLFKRAGVPIPSDERTVVLPDRDLQIEVGRWANRAFPYSTSAGRLRRLQRQIEKLQDDPNAGAEMAVALLVLFHHAHCARVDLLQAARHEFETARQKEVETT